MGLLDQSNGIFVLSPQRQKKMAFQIANDYGLSNSISPSSPLSTISSASSSPISSQFITNEGSTIFLMTPSSPLKEPNFNSTVKESVYFLTEAKHSSGSDEDSINSLGITSSETSLIDTLSNPIFDCNNEANLSHMVELDISHFSENGESVCASLGDALNGTDVKQNAQLKVIQIPSTVNLIQVPSNLLVTDNNLVLCLPSESITLQLQSSSPTLDFSMNGGSNELDNSNSCVQSSYTAISPIIFSDIIQTTSSIESNQASTEINLEKAQTWHKDSQLAIKALAALQKTDKLSTGSK